MRYRIRRIQIGRVSMHSHGYMYVHVCLQRKTYTSVLPSCLNRVVDDKRNTDLYGGGGGYRAGVEWGAIYPPRTFKNSSVKRRLCRKKVTCLY